MSDNKFAIFEKGVGLSLIEVTSEKEKEKLYHYYNLVHYMVYTGFTSPEKPILLNPPYDVVYDSQKRPHYLENDKRKIMVLYIRTNYPKPRV